MDEEVDTINPASSELPPEAPVMVNPLTSNWKPATGVSFDIYTSRLPSDTMPKLRLVPPPGSSGQSDAAQTIEPSQHSTVAPGPSHTPHSSSSAFPFGTPAQSAQLELLPPQTPHSS